MKKFTIPFLFFLVLLFLSHSFTMANCLQESKSCNKNEQFEKDTLLQNLPEIDVEYITMTQGVKHTLPLTNYLFTHIGKIPSFSESISNSVSSSLSNLQSLFNYSYQMLGSSAGGIGPPLSGIEQPVIIIEERDLDNFFEVKDFELINKKEWDKLPFSLKKGIVELLYAADEARTVFSQFSSPFIEFVEEKSSSLASGVYDDLIFPWKQNELNDFSSIDIIKTADLKKLSHATRILTEKLSWFITQNRILVPNDFKTCSIKSSLGELLINGTQNDEIEGEYFLILELGGDDVYTGNIASSLSVSQPFGIVIDFGGNDKYLSDEGSLVAGILGISALLDLSGNDHYKTNKPGLAFSLYGSSMLYDYEGNDEYLGNSDHSMGSAYVGTSLLVDVSGDDRYNCQSNSQGFGGTYGVGLFYDHTGDDKYNSVIVEGSKLDLTQSFIQGAAKGRWAEATDGQSLSGGIGIFIDNSGDDEYSARSFSQGASYYFGLGLFSDREGNDKYNSVSHSQGYAAHYSLAAFTEKKGDDEYNSMIDKDKISQIIGGGRDFSAGLFLEMEGDDTYHFGNRSAGIGDLNGIGLLADYKGEDRYIWHKNSIQSGYPSLGKSIELGQGMGIGVKLLTPAQVSNVGIFFDSHGANIFE